jgi:hypothetical protein
MDEPDPLPKTPPRRKKLLIAAGAVLAVVVAAVPFRGTSGTGARGTGCRWRRPGRVPLRRARASRSGHRSRLANSYYFDKNGDVPLRPTTTLEAYWRSRRFDLDDYRFTG